MPFVCVYLALTSRLSTFGLLEEEVRGRDFCHWKKGTNESHFSSALLPLFSFIVFVKRGGRWHCWRPLRLCREEVTRFFQIYHLPFLQVSYWVNFPVHPRVELQTIWNCYLKKRAKLYGGMGERRELVCIPHGPGKILSPITPRELFMVFLFAKSMQTFHLHQIHFRSFNCLL